MPNRNAFLAVALDEAAVESLRAAAKALVADPQPLLGTDSDVGFKPVDDADLHMTLLFFGEHLGALPAAELRSVYEGLCEVVRSACASAGASITERLEFCAFDLFPPEKNNLVVARFRPSRALLELRERVLATVRVSGLSLPSSLWTRLAGEGAWTPHVTLGKIRASKAQLGRVSCSAALQALAPAPAVPCGVTLLGQRPPRVWCDWEEALRFSAMTGWPSMPEGADEEGAEEHAAIACCEASSSSALPDEESPRRDSNSLGDGFAADGTTEPLPVVCCTVLSARSLRKFGRCVVELEKPDGDSIQVVGKHEDAVAGQRALVALPGMTLESGETVKRVRVQGEWSDGVLVRLLSADAAPAVAVARAGVDTASDAAELHGVLPAGVAVAGTRPGTLHQVCGDATLAQFGKGRKIVAHICNDQGRWGKGFVMAITDRWPEPAQMYRRWHGAPRAASGFRLGAAQLIKVSSKPSMAVANMIGQCGIKTGSKGPPVRYEAFEEALSAVAARCASDGASIHMPWCGAGLAGGERTLIQAILERAVSAFGVDIYVYEFSK